MSQPSRAFSWRSTGGGAGQAWQLGEVSGHGLLGIRERLAKLGGRLHIDGSDGWLLEVRIPQPAKEGVGADRPTEERRSANSLRLAIEEGRP